MRNPPHHAQTLLHFGSCFQLVGVRVSAPDPRPETPPLADSPTVTDWITPALHNLRLAILADYFFWNRYRSSDAPAFHQGHAIMIGLSLIFM